MYYTVMKHSGHLRTLEKRRKHLLAARAVHISLVFSNARRDLSQCNTRLRLLYVLNKSCIVTQCYAIVQWFFEVMADLQAHVSKLLSAYHF